VVIQTRVCGSYDRTLWFVCVKIERGRIEASIFWETLNKCIKARAKKSIICCKFGLLHYQKKSLVEDSPSYMEVNDLDFARTECCVH